MARPERKVPRFPPDKDLSPGEVMAASVVLPKHSRSDAGRIVDGLRESYPLARCDVIVMAMPEGKGRPFLDGLMESIQADVGGRADPPGATQVPIVAPPSEPKPVPVHKHNPHEWPEAEARVSRGEGLAGCPICEMAARRLGVELEEL